MAYGFVQQKENSSGATAQANIASGNFPSGLTAGNLVWIVVQYVSAAIRTWAFTDTLGQGANYVKVGSLYNATDSTGCEFGFIKNISGGTDSITGTPSVSVDFPSIYAAEFSGLDTTAPFTTGEFAVQRQASPATTTDAVTSGNTPTLAAQPAALIGFSFNQTSNNPPNAGTGFTAQATVWNFGAGGTDARPEDKRLTATTAVAATFTTPTGFVNLYSIAVVFKEAGAGGGAAPFISPPTQIMVPQAGPALGGPGRNLVNLLPTGLQPFNNAQWKLAPGPVPIQQLWIPPLNLNILQNAGQVPFRNNNPYQPPPFQPVRSWTQNLLESTLSTPIVAMPFNNAQWQLPIQPPRILQSWVQDLLTGTLQSPGTDWLVSNQYALPIQPPTQIYGWTQNLLLTTLSAPPQNPLISPPSNLPYAPPPMVRSWTSPGLQSGGLQPFFNPDSSIPRAPAPINQSWVQNLLASTLTPVLAPPFVNPQFFLTPAAPRPPPSWTQNLIQTTLDGQGLKPFPNYSWPLPVAPTPILQGWQQNLLLTTLAPPAVISYTPLVYFVGNIGTLMGR